MRLRSADKCFYPMFHLFWFEHCVGVYLYLKRWQLRTCLLQIGKMENLFSHCIDCNIKKSRISESPRCKSCNNKFRWSDKEYRRQISLTMKEKFNTEQMRNQCVKVAFDQWHDNHERKDDLAKLNQDRWSNVDYRDDVRAKISRSKGGSGDLAVLDDYDRTKMNNWCKSVKRRDNYICQKCGTNENIHAHHIKPKSKFPELKYIVENGMSLCQKCHFDLHRNS